MSLQEPRVLNGGVIADMYGTPLPVERQSPKQGKLPSHSKGYTAQTGTQGGHGSRYNPKRKQLVAQTPTPPPSKPKKGETETERLEREINDLKALLKSIPSLSVGEVYKRIQAYRAIVDLEKIRGGLVDADVIKKEIQQLAKQARNAWEGWPDRNAAVLASKLGVDPVKMLAVLRDAVDEELRNQSGGRA